MWRLARATLGVCLLVGGCAGSVVPKSRGVHVYKDTIYTKYVKNGKILGDDLTEVLADNSYAKALAEKSKNRKRLAIIPTLAAIGCLTWELEEHANRGAQGQVSANYWLAASCAVTSLLGAILLEHNAEALRVDAINTYNNTLVK